MNDGLNKKVYHLFFGVAFAQLIPFLFSPLLSRIYSPNEYALLGIMLVSSNIIFEFFTLKYDRTIVVSFNKIVSINMLYVCIFIALTFCVTLLILFSLFDIFDTLKVIHTDISILKIILPLITFEMSAVTVINYWFQRQQEFNKIVYVKILQMVSITAASVLLGIIDIRHGLIWGYFIGWSISFVYGVLQLMRTKTLPYYIKKSVIYYGLLKYKDYPIFNILPSLLYVLALSFPYYLVNYYYGNTNGGYFNMCKQMTLIPLGFVATAFSQVYIKKISDRITHKQTLLPIIKNITRPLLIIALISCLIMVVFGEKLFFYVLGEQWATAGRFSQMYIFSAVAQMIYMSLSIIFPTMHMIKTESLIKFLYFLLISFLFLYGSSDVYQFIMSYTLVETIFFLMCSLYLWFIVIKYDKQF